MFFKSAINFYVAFCLCFSLHQVFTRPNLSLPTPPGFVFSEIDTIPILVIDSIGRLGIGIEEPQQKLDVDGNIQFTGHLMPNGIIGDSGAVMISRGPFLSPVWDSDFRQGVWEDLVDRILFDKKNVEVGKTFVNKGDHQNSPYTMYNMWQSNIATSPDLPPFTLTGGEFPNPEQNQPNNYVYNFGSNLAAGGGILEPGKPAFGFSWEQRYFIDNVPHNEFHIFAVDETGVQRRPLTFIYAYDGSRILGSYFVSNISLNNKDGNKNIYTIDTETEEWNYDGNGLKHIFNTPNYQPIWQNNNDGTGNAYPLIGYLGTSSLTRRLQLGNPDAPIFVRMGSSLEFGNANGMDYIGTALGDGGSDLTFGYPNKRFNTIEFNTSYGIVTTFKNTINNNGWGLGLNAPGALYFRDFTSDTKPFYLSTSMPDNSFYMSPNGNLCLGCVDDAQKLSVNGSLKINGAFMPNNLGGAASDVLVSQGSALAPVWEQRLESRNEELFVSTAGQTDYRVTRILPLPIGTKMPVEVFRNGLKLKYNSGTLGNRDFNYLNDIITTVANLVGDEIEIVYFK